MTGIPDEAVDSYRGAYAATWNGLRPMPTGKVDAYDDAVRAGLAAALPHLLASAGSGPDGNGPSSAPEASAAASGALDGAV